MKKITIAIDGFSSTGKSTVAKELAKALSYIYVDTGAMYRAVTLYAIENGFISENKFDKKAIINALDKINLSFKFNKKLGYAEVFLNDKNVEGKIRKMDVSKLVSPIAEVSEIRKKLVAMQQEMGKDKGVVMDGRDIGTVVFPDAELKLFMTASADKRAKRRYKELIDKGYDVTFDEILENVEKRDYIDSHREDSPLIQAEDAVYFDNSNLGLKNQFERILFLAKNRIAAQ
jgi:cytidylate kinase